MDAKQLNLTPLYAALLWLAVVATFAMAAKATGIVINFTGSMPDAVYKIGVGERGSVASFCSPTPHSGRRGFCPDGSMPLVKRVVGVAGDAVNVTNDGVEINGHAVPNSRPLDNNFEGKALPHLRGEFLLKHGEIWVAGEHPNSFDSRYFGPVNK